MTGKIFDLAQERADRKPHVSGHCLCISCKHEWVQVEPVTDDGITYIACPKCERMTGRYRFPFSSSTALYWECMCGNGLFRLYIYKGEPGAFAFCPSCGAYKPLTDLMEQK